MSKGWAVYEGDGLYKHVVPIDDAKPHALDPDECWCGVTFDDGVWVHHSADRREDHEPRPLAS